MVQQLSKSYDPRECEEKWYSFWEKSSFFHAQENSGQKPYCIVIPPPNVTGNLHMGHALNNTLQDILIRWRRMQGFNTLWMPGTDHAGIATQNVVEQKLHEQGTNRHKLGREKFIERVWQWKEESGGTIIRQLKKLGASCDWVRERFTMDPGLSQAVVEVFVRLYEEGLIYRGPYIINWCPRCHTALSDLEVDYQEQKGKLYYIRYPLLAEKGEVVVATTRPETMLGDAAVAVNPQDSRYAAYIGKKVLLPLMNREIQVIADSYVDPQFGTGALKITPAHDANDFEIGKRFRLPAIKVIGEEGYMTAEAGKYRGLERFACREKVLKDLEEDGYLRKVEDYQHAVGRCYRCKTIVEPNLSEQWFVSTKPLAEPAIEAVKSGKVVFVPPSWDKTFFEWMNNIKDWCISRQIWWGHQIPAWYCDDCGEINVARTAPKACRQCQSDKLRRETDVLDTWFSSALWPFSTLGWPEKNKALEVFYPTSTLVTGFDILFFWVARMIMMGLKFMGDVPFREVYIHALVRDAEGQKMSKSKGNVVDPLVIIEKYGTDAFRFTLAAFAAQGRDIRLSEDRIEGYRHFCNKIWNASRFVLMNLGDYQGFDASRLELTLADKWLLSRLNEVTQEMTEDLEAYRFNEAAHCIYQFIWHEFCDWYIEIAKLNLTPETPAKLRAQTRYLLISALETCLRLLHPIMPFISEEIWQTLPFSHKEKSIIISPWPEVNVALISPHANQTMELIIDIIRTIRNLRSEANINPSKKVNVVIKTGSDIADSILEFGGAYIKSLAKVEQLKYGQKLWKLPSALTAVVKGAEIYIPLEGVINVEEERARLAKELKKVEKELERVGKKLANEDFLKKAPPEVIEKEKAARGELLDHQKKLQASINKLNMQSVVLE
jgi:valyl-tRNA synthetase